MLAVLVGMAGCMLFDPPRSTGGGGTGHVRMNLGLERSPASSLAKVATDTLFTLDSLYIELTAAGADTINMVVAISGRPDTGAIALESIEFDLPALRNWKARFHTIDLTDSTARDTVHYDSVVFAVLPADTAYVTKTITPLFSLLRARFLSSVADSIPDKVLYLRMRIDGVTRDSVVLGGRNATLRWLQTMPGTVIYAAGDSGRFLRSTNDAQTTDDGAWQEVVLTTNRLVGGYFPDEANGYVVSATGETFATTDSGKNWSTRQTAPDSLSAAWFTGTATGFSVGKNGGIYKTENNGNSWFTTESNTTWQLNGVGFPSADVGYVVGENETILRTVNGTAGDAPPEFGGIVWAPVAGGWFTQTSGSTQNLRGVHFISKDTGWAVGAGEFVRVTYNGGAVWAERDVGGISANDVTFTDASTGWIVANGGVIRKFVSEWDWRNLTTGTSADLLAVAAVGADTAWVVGASGTVRRTVNGGAAPSSIAWTAQAVPGPSAWSAVTTGTSSDLLGMHFANANNGWAVGAGGTIRVTTDGGVNWSGQTSGTTSALRATHFTSANDGVAVGDDEAITRTSDGGSTWSAFPAAWEAQTSGTANDLRGVHYVDATNGWAVGAGGVIRATSNGGANWTSQTSGTSENLRAVRFFDANRGVAVGDNEAITRTADGGATWTALPPTGWTSQTSGIAGHIRGMHFADGNTGWLVGDEGRIRKTTDAGANWTGDSSGKDKSLHSVFALTTDKAVAVGDSGIVLRTANGGITWDVQSSGVTANLRGTYFGSGSNGWFVGEGGTIRLSTDSGKTWNNQTGATGRLNAVYSNGSRVWTVGDSGRIYRRTSIGSGSFSSVSKGAIEEQHLYGVHFTSSNIGYVVGQGGLIARCSNTGNSNWVVQTSGVTEDLLKVTFTDANTGYVAGRNGTVLKTTNAGTNWTVMEAGAGSADLDALFAVGGSVIVGGTNGLLRTSFGGGTRSGRGTPQNLYDVRYVNGAVVYAVGDSGTLMRSTDSGATWAPRVSGTTARLSGIAGNATSRLLVVGDGGVVVRSTNPTNTNPTFTLPSQTATSENLNAIAMVVSSNTAYAVGDNGTIIKTRNSNNTPWALQNSGTTAHLRHVFFKGNGTLDTGYAVGDGGVVLRTLDSGGTWVNIPSGTSEHLYAVHFGGGFDTVTVVGAGGAIRKSEIGGGWSGGVPRVLRGLHFHSATVGFAVGDSGTVLNTRDGGLTWRPRASGTTARLRGASGFSTTRFLAVGEGGLVVRSANPTAATPTFNLPTQSATSSDLNAVALTSASIAIAVGDGGVIIKCNGTNNDNWAVKGAGLVSEDLLTVHFADANTGFVTGRNGTVLKTTDAGENWDVLDAETTDDLHAVSALSTTTVLAVGAGGGAVRTTAGGFIADSTTIRAVTVVNATNAHLVGDSGLVASTGNGGASWTRRPSGTTARLNGVEFANLNTGWIVGEGGVIRKTVDGGASWQAQTSGTSENLTAVHVLADTMAYASGASGVMLKTEDGGTTWYAQETPHSAMLNSVYFLNASTGFAVGENGTILNAVNEGDNWTGGGVKRSLKGVYFPTVKTGWIVGEDAVILKTNDSGNTWIEQYRDNGTTLYSVFFVDTLIGWVSGENGVVLRTTDGGASWSPQTSGSGLTLFWVNFRDQDRGFIIGGTESILQTDNGGSDWSGLFVGVPGDREFDRTLATRYLRAGEGRQVILDAVDRFSLPLRGYQSVLNLDVTAGIDTVLNAALSRCGHVDSIPCAP